MYSVKNKFQIKRFSLLLIKNTIETLKKKKHLWKVNLRIMMDEDEKRNYVIADCICFMQKLIVSLECIIFRNLRWESFIDDNQDTTSFQKKLFNLLHTGQDVNTISVW